MPDLRDIVQRMIDAGESEENIATVIRSANNAKPSAEPNTNTALELAGAGAAVPLAAKAATAFAQSPTAAQTGSAIARGLTTTGGIIHGIVKGSPAEVLAAPMEGWAAGKGGYFLTKGAQSLAAPVGRLVGKMAPYAQALSTASGAQGVGDLAQMAEPNRRDIGFLGIGPSVNVPGAKPPLVNALIEKIRALIAQRAKPGINFP